METPTGEAGKEQLAWLFLDVSEEEKQFYRRFVQQHGGAFEAVEQHGGAFEAVEQPADSYRLTFPEGTRIAPNEEPGLSLRESYHLVYPDGMRVTWYRTMKLDQRVLRDVLLVPVVEDQDWALFEGGAYQTAAQSMCLIPNGSTL